MNKSTARYIKLALCMTTAALLSACSGTKSNAVVELTKYDKHMDCSELQLEMTEARFLMEKAEKNRGLSVKNVLMPLSYPSTYFSADSAVEASTTRIDYLSRLYEIKGCENQRQASNTDYRQQGGAYAAPVGAAAGYGSSF